MNLSCRHFRLLDHRDSRLPPLHYVAVHYHEDREIRRSDLRQGDVVITKESGQRVHE